MDLTISQEADELFQAQAQLYKLVNNFVDSMSLKCAVQLGIPDAVHKHNQPITLHELVTALKLHPSKTSCLHRLMRVLVHSGFFANTKAQESDEEEEGYILTPTSNLLLKDKVADFTPLVQAFLGPAVATPWHCLGDWFRGNELTAFDRTHGMGLWEYCSHNLEFGSLTYEVMAIDSKMMSLVVKDLKPIFQGVDSLVDVGGGNGTLLKIISKEFPHLNCTVFDLPQVVNNLPESEKLKYIGGDMLQTIPAADAVLLKWIMHDWSDAECIKILKNCREAISSKGERGKVIIIDVVLNEKKDGNELTKVKLYFDMTMMTLLAGKERTEEEWAKLFLDAGFSHYRILATFGMKSLIEVYP